MNITNNVQTIQKRIANYEIKYQRSPGSVRLIAASKGQSLEKMQAAIAAGIHCFGENYLQEALNKIALLADQPIEWHFIGQIQSNKTKKIAEYFNWVHSIDDIKIARRLNDHRSPLLRPLNICIELNVHEEKNKAGVNFDEALSLLKSCQQLPRLKVRGLMAIPAPQPDFVAQRASFRPMYQFFKYLNQQGYELDTLSMGMSNDFEAAIAEGSTCIRLGTLLFGERSPSQ